MIDMKVKPTIAPPWIQYVNKLIALFGEDPDIDISYDNDSHLVMLKVNNQAKADAIDHLLPAAKQFGNVTLVISVVPSNTSDTKADLYNIAFDGNPAFSYVKHVDGVFTNPITYVVFNKEVVQYYNDDLGDVNGNCTTLYQDIAKDLFDDEGVYFCTDSREPNK